MPHLSPMNWLIVPIIMLILLFSMMVILWWQFAPRFPQLSKSSSLTPHKSWTWW